jgi:hypothetical protein
MDWETVTMLSTGETMAGTARRRVLIIVENLPIPFDRRVWSEATTLRQAGYDVSLICPKERDEEKSREVIDGVHVYRHPLPLEASGKPAGGRDLAAIDARQIGANA